MGRVMVTSDAFHHFHRGRWMEIVTSDNNEPFREVREVSDAADLQIEAPRRICMDEKRHWRQSETPEPPRSMIVIGGTCDAMSLGMKTRTSETTKRAETLQSRAAESGNASVRSDADDLLLYEAFDLSEEEVADMSPRSYLLSVAGVCAVVGSAR